MKRRPNLVRVLVLIAIGSVLVGLGLPPPRAAAEGHRVIPALVAGGLGVWALAAVVGLRTWWRGRAEPGAAPDRGRM